MKYPILFFCLLGLWGCSTDPTEEANTGNIAGSVSDQTTGEPVATVNVTLAPSGKSTVTGSDGSFLFVDLAPGDYTVNISKEGYNANSHTVGVVAGRTTEAHLTIERIPSIVTADREELDFGENASDNTRSFAIVNRSYEDLSWQIDCDCPWIKEIRPASGVLKWGKTETISVIINRDQLPERDNETTIVVRSTNGRVEVKIKATGPTTPVVNISDAIDISTTGATLMGQIINPGSPAYFERGFIYDTAPMPTLDDEKHIDKLTVQASSESEYSYRLDGLVCGQMYYVRAYAVNTSGTFYSPNQIQVVPAESLPRVATLEATDVDFAAGSATLWGTIFFEGDPIYTERGFVYGMMSDPTVNDNKIVGNGSDSGRFSIYATGLPKNTAFYVRAYAINKLGVAYGESVKLEQAKWIALPVAGIAVQATDIGYGYWSTINTMCENSILDGYTDWRLPTLDELMTMYDERDYIGEFVTYGDRGSYWSATSYPSSAYYIYYCINFWNGSIGCNRYSNDYKSARCVRTLNPTAIN